jgi:hypothetical protein
MVMLSAWDYSIDEDGVGDRLSGVAGGPETLLPSPQASAQHDIAHHTTMPALPQGSACSNHPPCASIMPTRGGALHARDHR